MTADAIVFSPVAQISCEAQRAADLKQYERGRKGAERPEAGPSGGAAQCFQYAGKRWNETRAERGGGGPVTLRNRRLDPLRPFSGSSVQRFFGVGIAHGLAKGTIPGRRLRFV